MSYYIAQNQNGGFSPSYPFDLPIDGDVTLAFCGTCWSNTAQALGGVIVYLDGQNIGDVPFFFNAASQHTTLPTLFVPINLSSGPHTITLQPLTANTIADENDFFSLWLLDWCAAGPDERRSGRHAARARLPRNPLKESVERPMRRTSRRDRWRAVLGRKDRVAAVAAPQRIGKK